MAGLELGGYSDFLIRQLVRIVSPKYNPTAVQIETTNRCNFACDMCQRPWLVSEYADMSFDLYKQVIDTLPSSITAVDLTGWGEPLMNRHIFEMVEYAKKRGMYVSFTSNGSLMDKYRQSMILSSGLDSLSISLDSIEEDGNVLSHPQSRTVRRNIEGLLALRGGKDRPTITLQPTLHYKGEQRILDVISYAGKIGIDKLNIARLDIRFNKKVKRPSWREEMKIYREAEKLGLATGVKVRSLLSVYRNWKLRPLALLFPHTCPHWLFNYGIYINLQGGVTPCCGIPEYELGNILEKALPDILKGKEYVEFHKSPRRICGNCDVAKYHYDQIDYK